jgi:hypothetical protein
LVLSLGNAVVTLDELEAKMTKLGRETKAIEIKYTHLPSIATEEKNATNREYLVVGWDPAAPLLRGAVRPALRLGEDARVPLAELRREVHLDLERTLSPATGDLLGDSEEHGEGGVARDAPHVRLSEIGREHQRDVNAPDPGIVESAIDHGGEVRGAVPVGHGSTIPPSATERKGAAAPVEAPVRPDRPSRTERAGTVGLKDPCEAPRLGDPHGGGMAVSHLEEPGELVVPFDGDIDDAGPEAAGTIGLAHDRKQQVQTGLRHENGVLGIGQIPVVLDDGVDGVPRPIKEGSPGRDLVPTSRGVKAHLDTLQPNDRELR